MLDTILWYSVLIFFGWTLLAILVVLSFRKVWHRAEPRRGPLPRRPGTVGIRTEHSADIEPEALVVARIADAAEDRRDGPPSSPLL